MTMIYNMITTSRPTLSEEFRKLTTTRATGANSVYRHRQILAKICEKAS